MCVFLMEVPCVGLAHMFSFKEVCLLMGGLCDEGKLRVQLRQSRKVDEIICLCCCSCSSDAENATFPVESVST